MTRRQKITVLMVLIGYALLAYSLIQTRKDLEANRKQGQMQEQKR